MDGDGLRGVADRTPDDADVLIVVQQVLDQSLLVRQIIATSQVDCTNIRHANKTKCATSNVRVAEKQQAGQESFAVLGQKIEVRRADSGNGVLGMGHLAPSPPARGFRERCKLPKRGPRRNPGRSTIFVYVEVSRQLILLRF